MPLSKRFYNPSLKCRKPKRTENFGVESRGVVWCSLMGTACSLRRVINHFSMSKIEDEHMKPTVESSVKSPTLISLGNFILKRIYVFGVITALPQVLSSEQR